MPEDLPRIVEGRYRLILSIQVFVLFAILCWAINIGASLFQSNSDQDILHVVFKAIVGIFGLIGLFSLPYFIMLYLTPKCDSCHVRTKQHGKLNQENEEWNVTICPLCRERFMFKMFPEDAD
jgi:hypothetical protein